MALLAFLAMPNGSVTGSCVQYRPEVFKMRNRDELKGKAEQIKGKVKQAAGDLTDDDRLRDEGVADEAAGNVQEGFGRARRKVGEVIEDIGENIKR
jgi:uncharacterized protein YjbJ (UPF0337 family)